MRNSCELLRKHDRTSCAQASMVIAAMTHGAWAAAPAFQGLGDLPGGSFSSRANGISADGTVVVGNSSSAMGSEAIRWTAAGGMVGLGDIDRGFLSSQAMNVSRNGLVVVGTSGSRSSFQEAFRWSGGTGMVGLGFLGFPQSISRGTSADGSVVVGRSGFGEPKLGGYKPFRWSAGTGMILVGDLPGGSTEGAAHDVSADGSVIVGYSSSEGGYEAFRWTAATGMVGLGDLPGGGAGLSSFAYAVSGDGSVVVGSGYSGVAEAIRWTEATGMVGIGALPAGTSQPGAFAADVSDDGNVIVGASNSSASLFGTVAFIWDPVHGIRDLKSVLTSLGLDLTGWTLAGANGVSANGQTIVGHGFNPSGQAEAWLARLPTPADLNHDGLVNGTDLGMLLAAWTGPLVYAPCPPIAPADLNGDCRVNGMDLASLLASWGF